jgi:hypothetical protein
MNNPFGNQNNINYENQNNNVNKLGNQNNMNNNFWNNN